MEQIVRALQERRGDGPSGLDDPFAAGAEDFGGMASVNGEELPVSGMTLGEIRHRLADRFHIEADSTMHLNGEPVDDENRVVRTGESVEFLRQAGEKGVATAFGRIVRHLDDRAALTC